MNAAPAEPLDNPHEPRIPLVDLEPATLAVRDAILDDLAQVMQQGSFVNGPAVSAFERVYAQACARGECVGVASGLDALRLILAALDIGAGDEVVVPAMTFVATFEAVAQVGATPVPVDVRDDGGLDAGALAAAITPSTRACIPVHLYGHVADMAAIEEVARAHGIGVVEDACQAHGARRDGRPAGDWSVASAFSFYPSKNLGAMGDAGAVVTDDEPLAERVRALRQHGETSRYSSAFPGYTARLDSFQAVVLSRKLPFLDEWNDARRRAAATYSRLLEGVGDLVLPATAPGSEPSWHLYAVRTADPASLATFLDEHGIGTGHHYPEPPHLSAAFGSLGYGVGAFPIAEAIARETISLPLYPGLSEAHIERVAATVEAYFERG
jgi:dTDP-3-amino-3,4,6-trideoxy-alpha-D-glucose transaminase